MPNSRTANQAVRTTIVEPVRGVQTQRSAANVTPGASPFSENWVVEDKWLRPRSGMSQMGSWSNSQHLTGVAVGKSFAYAGQDTETVMVFQSSSSQLASLKYSIKSNAFGIGASWSSASFLVFPSASTEYWSTAVLQKGAPSSVTFPPTVAVHPMNPPGHIGISGNSFTTLTEFYSIDSFARHCANFDDRTIIFNSADTFAGSSLSAHPTRVSWTGRGSLTSFFLGGFEDLTSMRGQGTGVVAQTDRMILFSDKETWAGRPRRDAYAFDFFALDQGVGLPRDYQRTPQDTSAGLIWLGNDFQFYRLIGNDVRKLGGTIKRKLRDEMREWKTAFAVYSPEDHTYQLWYSTTTGNLPNKALFLYTDTVAPTQESSGNEDDGVWMPQSGLTSFSLNLTVAAVYHNKAHYYTSEIGTLEYGLLSGRTCDATTTNGVIAAWRSPALKAQGDTTPYEALQELWIEGQHSGVTASTVSVYVSSDMGASFTAAGSVSFSSGHSTQLVPITMPATQAPMFEIRTSGQQSDLRIGTMTAKLRSYTGRYRG